MAVAAQSALQLAAGTMVGPYRIEEFLGHGGMGEVYRASDARLGRDLALKVIRGDAGDPMRVQRFVREARAASALDHPNIVVVYEFGEDSVGRDRPLRYLAMELLKGQSLLALLTQGPLGLRPSLDIGSQLADGLARAHEAGILHRDLKPSNVWVTPDGRVKILDFGLAKPLGFLDPRGEGDTPTEITTEGTPLGTPGYMSPEQATGRPTGPASDQFSLGCILFEALTGVRPFHRSSSADTLTALLRDDPPPLLERDPEVPPLLRLVVERCLAKRPEGRYAATRDLARDLHTLKERLVELRNTGSNSRAEAKEAYGSRRRLAGMAVASLLAAAAGFAAAYFLLRGPKEEPTFRHLTFRRGAVHRALFTPNGLNLYSASWDGGPARTFLGSADGPGADRALDAEPQVPLAYDEDGANVLVLLGLSRYTFDPQANLAWWPALGGNPRRILEGAGWSDWARRRRLLAVAGRAGAERTLELRDADGTPRRELFRAQGGISAVRFSPDETLVAFCHHPRRSDDACEIRVVPIDAGVSRPLTPVFERCGGLVWNARTQEVWFSFSRGDAHSSSLGAVTVAGRARTLYNFPDFFRVESLDSEGRLLIVGEEDRRTMKAVRAGGPVQDISWMKWSLAQDLSPDGRTVLFHEGTTAKTTGLWVRSLEGGEAIRLADAEAGRFSADGQWVAAVSRAASGPPQILIVPVGAGVTRRLSVADLFPSPVSFAGPRQLLFARSTPTGPRIFRIGIEGGPETGVGEADCTGPVANPAGTAFLCLGSERDGVLRVQSMGGGPARDVFRARPQGRLVYYRWDSRGERAYGVTRNGSLLTVELSSGRVSEERLSPGADASTPALSSAALSEDATTRVFSALEASSQLSVARGFN